MPRVNPSAELNGPQLQAVTTLDGPVLIIAGAGSGKTRVITCRIAHMLETGVPQRAILALTFTNKAAREMEARVKELTGKPLQSLTVSTFHAFGVKILREEIERLGYRKNFSIYDETDKNEAIRESLRERRISPDGVDIYQIGQAFSRVKTGMSCWRSAAGAAGGSSANSVDDVWKPVFEEYQQNLKVYNAVDFDDLLALPLALFETFPEALDKYHSRYRYLMVDEFQDTSLIQYRLLKTIAWGRDASPSQPSPNVCVVGDDDQSIYSWRGASYENLASFERDFPGTREIKLEQNYRSTSTILEAANGVIANNTNRKEKRLWSGQGGGKPIEVHYPEDERDEAAFIAGQLKTLRFRERLGYDGFGVLVRTNSQTAAIEEAFLAENIPYRVSGGTSFFQRKEVKDIISYLRVTANPDDDVNLLRIINTPRRGIGKAAILAITALAKRNHSSLWNALERFLRAGEQGQQALFGGASAESANSSLGGFISLVNSFREEMRGAKNLAEKVKALVERVDYWSYLVSEYSKNEKTARWKFANISYLIETIERWERDPDNLESGLYAWLNRISLLTRDDGGDDGGGKVNLMTIHASKGLEFPVVFIAGAEDGIIPHERSLEDGGGEGGSVEEERRLFYVAITRARDKLIITSCRKRRRNRELADRVPSPFLTEIPPRLIEVIEDGGTGADSAGNETSGEEFFSRMIEQLGKEK
ncbi:MAG: DNA helicase, UvrD/pcrA family [Treponematales bacterium]